MKLIDKDALVAEIEKLQSEIAEEKKLHEDNSMWYNGINHGFNLTKDILNTLEVKDLQEEPVSIDFEQELYKAFGQVKDFTLGMRIAKWFYDMGKNSQEPVSEDFETTLAEEWKGYNDRGAATVDALEDNTQELAFAKGFYRGWHYRKKEPVSIWHDSNEEQPNFSSTVAIWNPKYKNGEIISRCTEVYSDRIWAYIDDLLKI